MTRSPAPGCPIRTSAHQRVFAPTRGLSQLITSFVASESQGILHVPFSPFLLSILLAAAFGGSGSLRLALNFESRLVCRVCRGLRRGSLCDFVFDLLVFCPTAAYGRFRTSLPSCQCALFPAGWLAGRPCGPRLAPAWWRITDSNR